MEHPKRNRGARSGWPLAAPRTLIASLALAGAIALPGVATAQESCGGSLTNAFVAPTPAIPRFVGDTLRLRATMTNTTVDSPWEVHTFDHKLDCANAGNFFTCVDDGTVMTYVGNITTNCQDAANADVTWGANTATTNLVSFTPSNPVILDIPGGAQASCYVEFDIQIASLSNDLTPNSITYANDAEGDCGVLPGGAQGSGSTSVDTCGITLKKQVQNPDTLAWLDADNAVNGDGEDLLQVIFKDADPTSLLDTGNVLYRLVVKNTSSVAMSSVMVSDPDLSLGATEVGPLTAGQEKTVTSGDIGALNAVGRCLASGNLENTSTATGICRATAPVVDEAASNNAFVQCVGVPHITILKEVSLTGAAGTWFDANAADGSDGPVGALFGADAYYRITVTNDGTVDLKDVLVNDATLGITDYSVGNLAVGASVVLDQGTSALADALLFEGRCDIRGVKNNLASVTGKSVETDESVTDEDPANLLCVGTPGIDIEKQISIDGKAPGDPTKVWQDADTLADPHPVTGAPSGAQYRFIVTNTGTIPLVNVVVEDTVLGIPATLIANLAVGASVTINSGTTGFGDLLVAERCSNSGTFFNSASVTASPFDDPAPASAVTDSDPAVLECTGNDLCLTHTPGFWGTHPDVTVQFLPITVCGAEIDTTTAETGKGTPASPSSDSSAEAMCMSGVDAKNAGVNVNYLQLVRQLTAAKLNVAASATNEGTCDTVGGVDIDALIARCEAAALCGDKGAKAGKLITASLCIEQLDAFNNSDDTLAPFGPFVTPGAADPTQCQLANGNGFIVK